MTSRIVAAAIFLGSAPSVLAQPPLIYSRSIYNAATFMPAGIPGAAIAQGSMFSLFGARIGPAKAVTASSYPLGSTLGGVSLNIIQGNTTVAAIPIYVSASQINAIMPSNAPLGLASAQVVVNGSKSNLSPLRITANAFGIFTALGTGFGPGVLQNFVAQDNQPYNQPAIPAQPGQVITLWGTGLGAVPSDTVAPSAGNLAVQTEVFVGGVSAAVAYNGRTPCCAGIDPVVFTVPANAPHGCWVPVYVLLGGTTVSNVVTMAIEPAGTPCSTDIFPQIADVLVNGGTAGAAGVARAATHEDIGTAATVDVTADYSAYFATTLPKSQFPFHPVVSFPPSGTCTAFTLQGDMLGGDALPGLLPNVALLDFGPPASFMGPDGTKSPAFSFDPPWPASLLGGEISNGILANSLFLDPGNYTVKTTGGNDVAGFTASFSIPQPLTWTNRDQLNKIDRTKPLTISWSGGDAGQIVAVIGFSDDLPSNSSAAFGCIAPPGANSFTVPVDFLSNLPPSRANPLRSKQVIYLLDIPGASVQKINANGIGAASTGAIEVMGKTVAFQ